MTTYQYQALRPAGVETRLVTIQPGASSDEIWISLNDHSLVKGNEETYETLSYAWGSTDDPRQVLVDQAPAGKNAIQVTQNLDAALRHLRLGDAPRQMWIDALCIDQGDNAERSRQVSHMGAIYRSARRTVVWLGPAGGDSDFALGLLGDVGAKVAVDWHTQTAVPSEEGRDEPGHADVSRRRDWGRREACSLDALFGRSWFERLWVRQEVTLSKAVVLHCGAFSLDWKLFCGGVFSLVGAGCNISPQVMQEIPRYPQRGLLVYSLCLVAHHYPFLSHLRFRLQDLKWKDPKDSLYACANIVYDMVEIQPDYDKPTARVFEDVVTAMVQARNYILFLESCDISSISLPELPTWVPDWSTALKVQYQIHLLWSASGFISGHNELLGNGILRTAGVRVAVVDHTHAFPPNSSDQNENIVLKYIQKLIPARFDESSYVGGGSLLDAYCRALYCIRPFSEGVMNGLEQSLSVQDARDSMLSIWRWNISEEMYNTAYDFPTGVHQSIVGRSFFTTNEGYVGLAPAGTRPGDVLCVLLGVNIPILLRPTIAEPTTEQNWQVVGPCNVPGLMSGEAIYGPLPDHYRPVKNMGKYVTMINGIWGNMRDERDGKDITDPTKILDEMGIRWERHSTEPHLLEVLPETLRAVGIDVQHFDLV